MKRGNNYLLKLNKPPSFNPPEGGWAQIRYQREGSLQVTPQGTTQSPGLNSVHIQALADGRDPVAGDEFVYRSIDGHGESREIVSFTQL